MREQIASDIRGWDAIRDHRTGTEGDAATATWLASLVGAAGVEPAHRRVPLRAARAARVQRRGGGTGGPHGGRPAAVRRRPHGCCGADRTVDRPHGRIGRDRGRAVRVQRRRGDGGAAARAQERPPRGDRGRRGGTPGRAGAGADQRGCLRRAVRAAGAAGRQRTRGLARRRRRPRRKRPSDGAYEHRADRRAQRAGAHRGGRNRRWRRS